MAKVCMLVTNPVTNDPRVRREASALAAAGHEVVVLGVADGKFGAAVEVVQGVTIRRTARLERALRAVVSPRAFVDARRDGALRTLSAWHPGAYAVLRDLYVRVRYGGELPAEVVAAAEAAGAAAAGALTSAGAAAWTPRPLTAREKLAQDADTVLLNMALNLRLARLAIAERADVIHAHDLDTLLAGVIAKRATGARLVYDFHELYPEQHADGVKTSLWRGYFERLERLLIDSADALITVNEPLARWTAQTYGVPQALPLMSVPPFEPVAPRTLEPGAPRTVLYHGIFCPDRGLEELIESARYLRGARVVLRGVGTYERELRRHAHVKGVADLVTFVPPVPMTELVRSAREADVGVLPFRAACLNTYYCLPNKLFEYMMAGLAIVAADLPELRRIVEEHGTGVLCDPRDARSLAGAINDLVGDDQALARAQERSLRAAAEVFNWEREQQKLLDLYADLGVRRGSSGSPRTAAAAAPSR
jgi:glycosyltransferase involved in cell wall biosynthesis